MAIQPGIVPKVGPIRLALGLGLAGILAIPARGDDGARPGEPLPSDPVFKALRLDGTTASGKIQQLGPDASVVLVDGANSTRIPLAQVVKLTRDGETPASPPEGSLVAFPDGDRLQAQIFESNDTTLSIAPKFLGDATLAVPLDAPLAMILAPSSDLEVEENLIRRVRDEPRKTGLLWLDNGDVQAGDLLGLSAQKVSFQRDAGAAEFERANVIAIGFDPKTIAYPKPKKTYLELDFLDGSRLGVVPAQVEKGKLNATTRFGATIRPPISDLARIHVRSEAIAYLSERPEALAEYTAYVGPHRGKLAHDRTVDGKTLRLGGKPHDHGLGTSSRTILAYRLDPKDLRFQATVGLDDRAGPYGNVVFRVVLVKVEREEKFLSPPMSGRDTPLSLDVDLAGARLLLLITEFGDRGNVQDVADWVDARIIRRVD